MKSPFTIQTENGNTLYCDHYGSDLPANAPAILYIHGFKGFKDWGFVPYMAKFLAGQGFRVITFNFSHNGVAEDFLNFTAPEKFRENTFSLEVSEAREMIQRLRSGQLPGLVGERKVGILGHSRGGGVALLAGSQNPDVDAICTWASVATFDRYSDPLKKLWREQGFIEVVNSRTGQVFQMGINLLEDLEENGPGRLNIRNAVENDETPLCIIHGNQDEAVAVKDARAIYEWANSAAIEMHIIPEAGHTFGAKHPFAGTTPQLEEALAHSLTFLQQHLQAEGK